MRDAAEHEALRGFRVALWVLLCGAALCVYTAVFVITSRCAVDWVEDRRKPTTATFADEAGWGVAAATAAMALCVVVWNRRSWSMRRKWIIVIIATSLGIAAIVGLFVTLTTRNLRSAKLAAEAGSKMLLVVCANWQIDPLAQYATERYRGELREPASGRVMHMLAEMLGPIQSATVTGFRATVRASTAGSESGTVYTCEYAARFERKSARVQLILHPSGDGWQVDNLTVDTRDLSGP